MNKMRRKENPIFKKLKISYEKISVSSDFSFYYGNSVEVNIYRNGCWDIVDKIDWKRENTTWNEKR